MLLLLCSRGAANLTQTCRGPESLLLRRLLCSRRGLRGVCSGFGGATRFLLARRDHHDHLPAFQFGELLDNDQVRQLVTDALQQRHPQFLVRDFTTAKTQRDLALVTLIQETLDVAQLDVVVTIVGPGAEFDFLDLDDLLL